MAFVYLHEFRNELDEEILERGYFYFRNGWIKKITEILPGFYEAVIEEASPQAVTFRMNESGKFSEFFCTCGDTRHIFCRHAAAILFHYESLGHEAERSATWEDIETGKK